MHIVEHIQVIFHHTLGSAGCEGGVVGLIAAVGKACLGGNIANIGRIRIANDEGTGEGRCLLDLHTAGVKQLVGQHHTADIAKGPGIQRHVLGIAQLGIADDTAGMEVGIDAASIVKKVIMAYTEL